MLFIVKLFVNLGELNFFVKITSRQYFTTQYNTYTTHIQNITHQTEKS
jgi:hypothetical protein